MQRVPQLVQTAHRELDRFDMSALIHDLALKMSTHSKQYDLSDNQTRVLEQIRDLTDEFDGFCPEA